MAVIIEVFPVTYVIYGGSECEKCGKLHINKIVNRCDTCRVGVCDDCGKQKKNADPVLKKKIVILVHILNNLFPN